jgi:hypothetical protein
MKTIFNSLTIALFFILSGMISGFAQESNQDPFNRFQTILGTHNKVSGFGSIINQVSYSNNNQIYSFYSVGLEGGILFNQRTYLGIFGISSLAPSNISKIEFRSGNYEKDIHLVQTGLLLGRKFSPNSAIHLNFSTRVGGGILIRSDRYNDNWNYDNAETAEGVFLISPSLSIEANLFTWMQLHAGGGYTFMTGNQVYGLSPQNDLSLPYLQFGISFGGFR